MAGYVDSDAPAKSRPWRLMLACLFVGLAFATAAYYFLVDRTPYHFFVPSDEPLLIGLPLAGEAIHQPPHEVTEFNGGRFIKGKVKFVITNVISNIPAVIQFPPKAGYLLSGPNSYSPVESKNWPEFAQATETIVLPPGGSRAFVSSYSFLLYGDDPWHGENWCFVFTTDEAAGQQGEPFNGCLSFRPIMELTEEANESKNLARGEEQSSGSSESQQ